MRTIMHDRRLHFLVPFALPSAADAASSLHTLDSPALEKLLARASLVERVAGEDFQRTLPHERWLARQFGATQGNAADEAPLAPYMLLADGGDPGAQAWACVGVHVEIAHDHPALVDPAALALDEGDAAALLAVARPLIESSASGSRRRTRHAGTCRASSSPASPAPRRCARAAATSRSGCRTRPIRANARGCG